MASAPAGSGALAADTQEEPASGPGDEAKAEAMAKYEQGVAAFKRSHYRDAIDLFLAGDTIVANPAFAYNIGLAYEAMGDSARALEWTREYLRRSPGASDRADALARIARHEKKLQDKGLQQVSLFSDPTGATVTLDGRAVGVTPWTGEVPPGKHQALLTLRGYVDAQQPFDLTPERTIDVLVTLREEGGAPLTSSTAAAPPTSDPDAASPATAAPSAGVGDIAPWTWVALGLGVGGLGAALGLEVARAGADADAVSAPTQVEALDHHETATDLQLGARIAVGVGGAFMVAGVVLLIVDLSSAGDESEPSAARLGAACVPGFCGAFASGAW